MIAPATALSFLELVYLPRNPQAGEKTADNYRGVCRSFDAWSGGISIPSLAVEQLSKYLDWYRTSGHSNRTVNNHRQVLLTLWKFAHDDGHKDSAAPSKRRLPKLREPRRQPNAFTLHQMQILKKACLAAPQIPRFRPARWTGKHWWTTSAMIWDTGHRVSALLAAKRDHIDSAGYLRIEAEDTKHLGEMVHRLKESTLALIDELPRTESGLILEWPYRKRQIWIRYEKDVLIPSGLPFDARHKFHCLRRTSASHLYAATGDIYAVMRHLGHRRVETTWGYIDTRIGQQNKSAAELLDEI